MHSRPKTQGQSVSVSSSSLSEYSNPGIILLRRKLIRCTFWNIWRQRYLGKIRQNLNSIKQTETDSLLILVENTDQLIRKRAMFDKWRRCLISGRDPLLSTHDPAPSDSIPCTKQYEEFMFDLQSTAQSIARHQTKVDTLDAKLNEIRGLYDVTKRKAIETRDEVSQASDKYDELLKMVSQKKVEHRDLVSELQEQIDRVKQDPLPRVTHDFSAQDRISREHAVFRESMDSLKSKCEACRGEALELRMELDKRTRENKELESEIQKLSKEKEEMINLQQSSLKAMQSGECLKLMKLLMRTDKQLKETAEKIDTQNTQIKELDVQIIKRRKALMDLKSQNVTTKRKDVRAV